MVNNYTCIVDAGNTLSYLVQVPTYTRYRTVKLLNHHLL